MAGNWSVDVDYDHVAPKCSYITPVPGGVGTDDYRDFVAKHDKSV